MKKFIFAFLTIGFMSVNSLMAGDKATRDELYDIVDVLMGDSIPQKIDSVTYLVYMKKEGKNNIVFEYVVNKEQFKKFISKEIGIKLSDLTNEKFDKIMSLISKEMVNSNFSQFCDKKIFNKNIDPDVSIKTQYYFSNGEYISGATINKKTCQEHGFKL